MSELYHGETYDARLEKAGWTSPGFDDRQWAGVTVANHPKDDLVAPAGPPVRRIEELKPVKIFRTPGGDTVADLGQNLVGWVRLRVQGPAGTTVTLRHAEVLDKQGNFYTENLRKAKATLQYTLKGGGPETFEPFFTFFGFRYVAVDGFPGEITADALTGIVVHSDMARASQFETSKALVNQLQHNIIWGQKGNFLDVPTDCPQRDERLGWTGDAQAFSPTAAFNMDVAAFFTKWLADMAADQFASGAVPHVVPNVLPQFAGRDPGGAAGWADAATIIPWTCTSRTATSGSWKTVRAAWRAGWSTSGRARATTSSGTAISTSETGSPSLSARDGRKRLPGRDHGQGLHRHCVLRAFDGPAPSHRARAGQDR